MHRNREHYGYGSYQKDDAKQGILRSGDSHITATNHPRIGIIKVFLKHEGTWSIMLRHDGKTYCADGKTRVGAERAVQEKFPQLPAWKI